MNSSNNSGGGMGKRVFLALFLSFLVVLGFSMLEPAPNQSDDTSAPTGQPNKQVSSDTGSSSASSSVRHEREDTTAGVDFTDGEPLMGSIREDTVPFQTDALSGYFHLPEASLGSVKLRSYSRLDHPDRSVDLVRQDGRGLGLEFQAGEGRASRFHAVSSSDSRVYRFE
ncbi:MAG: hypothetical protein ABEK50_15070, partial [bacterium]